MNKAKIIFIGHLTLDDTVLPNAETHFNSLGGAALYSAAGALLWKENVGIVARIGNDYNENDIQKFNSFGVDTAGIKKHNKPNIHIWALYDRNGNRYFIPQKNAGTYESMAPTPEEIPVEYLRSAEAFHIAPMPLPCQEKVVNKLTETNSIISLDPHHEWVGDENTIRWEKLLSNVHIFLPSEDEFIEFWGIRKQKDYLDYIEYLKQTSALGPEIVVLKLGARGVMFYESRNGRSYHVPTIAKKVIDVTGAGDAFCGGFIYGYLKTSNPLQAAKYGSVSSSFVVEDFGPGHMFHSLLQDVEDRLNNLEVKLNSNKIKKI